MSQMTVTQMSISETTDSPQHKLHWLAEQALSWSGLPVVTVRPTVFLEGFFLLHTKTFHDVCAVLATPAADPLLTFLVSYGHLLIGLSLLVGLMVRVSAAFAVALLLMYWTAHMDWPFIENRNNLIVDYHIVYAVLCVCLVVKRAGHVWGLDAWAEKLPFVQEHATLRPLVA
jgi:thiosulfate dehydrogenase [quinone] large subunit